MLPSTFYYIEFAIKLGKMVLMGLDRKSLGGGGRERDGKKVGWCPYLHNCRHLFVENSWKHYFGMFSVCAFHNDSVNKLLSWVFENIQPNIYIYFLGPGILCFWNMKFVFKSTNQTASRSDGFISWECTLGKINGGEECLSVKFHRKSCSFVTLSSPSYSCAFSGVNGTIKKKMSDDLFDVGLLVVLLSSLSCCPTFFYIVFECTLCSLLLLFFFGYSIAHIL